MAICVCMDEKVSITFDLLISPRLLSSKEALGICSLARALPCESYNLFVVAVPINSDLKNILKTFSLLFRLDE